MNGIRGGRPKAEFVDDTPRKQGRRLDRVPKTDSEAPNHIDLRIIRPVVPLSAPNELEWNDFLNALSVENRALGTTRSLGMVAITYVPSKHMNSMLRERWPRDFHHPRHKLNLFRKMNASINNFLRAEDKRSFDGQLQGIEATHRERLVADYDPELDEIFAEAGMPRLVDPDLKAGLSAAEVEELEAERVFGRATLTVSGIEFYGKSRYGLDLSHNDVTRQERQSIVNYLRYSEGLGVQILDQGWAPHATIFRLHEHIPASQASPVYDRQDLPGDLLFQPPKTENYGL